MIYFIYVTLSTGEEIRTDICYDWKNARKIMLKHKRNGLRTRAMLIDSTNEKTENRSISSPVYYTI